MVKSCWSSEEKWDSEIFVVLGVEPHPSKQMNRSDLVQLLYDRFSQLTQGDAETAVSTILEAMNSAMVRGHRIEIRGFGSFSVIHRASRMGRNPRRGAPVENFCGACAAFQARQSAA